MKEFIETGRIVTTHGVHGEVKAEAWCDEPEFLAARETLHVGKVGQIKKVLAARIHKNMVLLTLEGVNDIEAAAALRGSVLFVHRDEIPLKPGEHLIQDLIGLSVHNADTGERYGLLTDVLKTGANDVYQVRFENGRDYLIPVIEQVVLEIDLPGGVVKIRPLEGLFE